MNYYTIFVYCTVYNINAHDVHNFVAHDTLVEKDEKVQVRVAAAKAKG